MTDPNLPDDALRETLQELAAEEAPGLLERARARALARAERLIEDLLVEDLLAAASALHQPALPEPARRTAREPKRAADGRHAAKGRGTADGQTSPERRAKRALAPEPRSGDELWWTYCVLREPDAAEATDGLEGVEPGTRVEAIRDGGLIALVSPVPVAEYGDERLREHLEDLAWVERTARRHEDVLEAALRKATIVPLRLCTLYRDRAGVQRLLREHHRPLTEGLGRVEGCVEWGVKVFADPDSFHGQSAPEPGASDSSGAKYLLRRQHERALAEKATEVRARCVEVAHQRIAALARSSRSNPPQRPEVHGRELTMLLNGAYLVERGRTEEVQGAARTLQEEWGALGFTIELTGPWPPYNFVSGAAGVMS